MHLYLTPLVFQKKQAKVQLEAYLLDFLHSQEAYRKMKEITPWFFDRETGKATVAPNKVHQMQEWGTNTLLNKQDLMGFYTFSLSWELILSK